HSEQLQAMLDRQVGHLVRLVDDLLDVSRVTRGHIALRKERAELAAIVETALETSRHVMDAARHRLAVTLPGEPTYVEADPMRVAQVLTNLLNNAAKYTDPGGEITLEAARRGDEVAISVRDTGIGISAEMLPKVFDMFTQANNA